MNYTNNFNVPISLATWLINDGYDHSVLSPTTFSVTELIKPVKQIILSRRALTLEPENVLPKDIISFFNARVGQSVHAVIEQTWESPQLLEILKQLGHNPDFGNKIVLNPTPEELKEDIFPIWMEQRRSKKVGKYEITGQYDFNFNGQLEDFKFTKTYSATTGVNDEHYIKQGSMYRWIFPDQISSDTTQISWMFGDWMAGRVGTPNYPAAPILTKQFPLMSIPRTEMFVRDKLAQIDKLMDSHEADMPQCTSDDLWQKPTVWKYYAKKDSARATKNFDNFAEANLRLAKDGNKGIVKEVKGEVIACKYCSAFQICKQKNQYLLDGSLNL